MSFTVIRWFIIVILYILHQDGWCDIKYIHSILFITNWNVLLIFAAFSRTELCINVCSLNSSKVWGSYYVPVINKFIGSILTAFWFYIVFSFCAIGMSFSIFCWYLLCCRWECWCLWGKLLDSLCHLAWCPICCRLLCGLCVQSCPNIAWFQLLVHVWIAMAWCMTVATWLCLSVYCVHTSISQPASIFNRFCYEMTFTAFIIVDLLFKYTLPVVSCVDNMVLNRNHKHFSFRFQVSFG